MCVCVAYTHKPTHHTPPVNPGMGLKHVAADHYNGEQLVVRCRYGVEGDESGVWKVVYWGGAGQRVIGHPQGHPAAVPVPV